MSLMGVDIGTTGVKAVCFSPEGKILSSAYQEYPTLSPKPGWMELAPDRVWEDTRSVIARAADECPDPVTALGISCLGEAIAQIDKNGKVVRPTIVGFDNRAKALAEKWLAGRDRLRLMEISGHPPSQLFTLFKLMWVQENEPENFNRIDKALCYQDWAIYKMGIEPVVDYSTAARTMALDVRTGDWSREISDESGVNVDIWPKAVPGGTIAGEIGAKAAAELNLPTGCKVVTGAHDQPAGALGAGVIEGGVAIDATGTVECIALAVPELIVNEVMLKSNFACYPHAVPGLYITLGFNPTGGSLLRWFRDTLAGEEAAQAEREGRDVYEILMDKMAEDPTNLFVLPHFTTAGTPYMDPTPMGAIAGLTLTTTKSELIRAVIEGITWEMKLNLSLMSEAGIKIDELRAIGGGAKSERWLQIKADMFDKPVVRLAVTEAVCLGGAISAGVATGVYSSYKEATDMVVKNEREFTPDPKRASFYNERRAAYREIYPSLKNVQSRLPEGY